ncbi:hypothetical protein ITX44_26335 [Streptomyces sp. KK5PA1]|uniref:Uncharacterized protein n=1 Tax=Actinacidiphila acididurans TaxID=2784346 RepID=A0ABS2TXD2_9ACTN|nr:hypothetical protein [Actinacidiphila acididurans]
MAAAAADHRKVTITREPSGSVVARGGDSLAVCLLDHAGFPYVNDWHGPRHRLPAGMPPEEQAVAISDATRMLRAARYQVDLDPVLDAGESTAPTGVLGPYRAGAELLAVTDRIGEAGTGHDLAHVLDHLLHPEHGALERLREALEAASEKVSDLDDEAFTLADRLTVAAEFVGAAEGELVGIRSELEQMSSPEPSLRPVAHAAALVKSPAAAEGRPSHGTASAPQNVPPLTGPGHTSAPRTR